MKKNLILFSFLFLLSCQEKQASFAPIGQQKKQKSEMRISMDRNRALNEIEREDIAKWIETSGGQYYLMPLNYWTDIENLSSREPNEVSEKVSFAFYLYDFDEVLIYKKPISYRDIPIEKIPDLEVMRDVMKYLKVGEEVNLLVPSILAYGTNGDGKKIGHDIPLIIKIKRL
ncbi:MAG: hypothetical protein CSA38_04665 [Flavobacteriales bacterium]|nr:MAG: hypothetical protein CSA38_04665 [Flavobacteriales bacterium]